ncbi:MAG: ASKHA domain-containing protein [Candidatus Binatia bacterium]
MTTHRVCFLPSGECGEIAAGTTLREAARLLGVGIETICGGQSVCGKCKVRVLEGPHPEQGIASHGSHVSPPTPEELRYTGRRPLRAGERLSCQARVRGDVVVYVPEESRVDRPIILKAACERSIDIAPTLHQHYVRPAPPSLTDPRGDWERLGAALDAHFALPHLRIDPYALRQLPAALRAGDGAVTATVWNGQEVIRIEPGYSERAYGLAVDLGTTTVAAYLCDVASGEVLASSAMMNPQIAHGEDVMNRIASSKGRDRLEAMRRLVVDAVGALARETATQASIAPLDIAEVVLVANTAMHHIFLGLDVQALGIVPFTPAVSGAVDVKARDVGLAILPSANVHLLPIEAAFVGADNVAVLIAEEPHRRDEVQLIIDIGTNAELLLGNRDRLLSASCPTGPALEGACIKFGTRATPGAIDKVRIDPATGDVRFRVIGNPRWSTRVEPGTLQARGLCGSAILETVAEMFHAGIVDRSGRIRNGGGSPRVRPCTDGGFEFVVAWAEQTAIGIDITVTQEDVRAIQLAKAALYTGGQLLLRRFGIARPDRVTLAGAFGSVIDVERALWLGMFPDCGIENVRAVGNAAGDGARIALLNRHKRAEAERMARQVEYVELTAEPGFMDAFVDATHLPHATDHFPSLADGWLAHCE